MSFTITNNSANAVVGDISTNSSTYGSFTITSGSFPLLSGDTITGTNTLISNLKGSPYGTILLYLQQGDAQIEVYINSTLYSALDYSSGIASIQVPIIQAGDTIQINIDEADLPTPSMTPTPSVTAQPTATPTPSVTPTLTPTPSATQSIFNPQTLGAQWWIDFTNASSLALTTSSPPIITGATDQVGLSIVFSSDTSGPQYFSTQYDGVSGACESMGSRLQNPLGSFNTSHTDFTWFGFVYDDVVSQRGGKYIETYNNGFPLGTEGLKVSDDNNPPNTWYARARDTGGSYTQVGFDHTYSAWTAIAIRAYNSGGDTFVEAWENGSIIASATTASSTLTTKVDMEYSLMYDGGINYCTEQFYFTSKLSNGQMAQAFQYITDKY